MNLRHAMSFALLAESFSRLPARAQQTPTEMAGKRENGASQTSQPPNFRWMRIVDPPRRAPRAEACIVLDADTFSHAAPALRDLRLYQDGVELPYVIEQSFDERALDSGETPRDDRSLYETSAAAMLQRVPQGPTDEGVAVLRASVLLPAHVPVERIRLENAPSAPASLGVRAAITSPSLLGGGAESTQGQVSLAQPTLPFTIGADLQGPAEVTVFLTGRGIVPGQVFLEMRRRSLCYHPESASPLTLYLGGDNISAESDLFARTFQSETERPTATLGALQPNPEYRPPVVRERHLGRHSRLLIAVLAFVAFFLLNVRRHWRKRAARSA